MAAEHYFVTDHQTGEIHDLMQCFTCKGHTHRCSCPDPKEGERWIHAWSTDKESLTVRIVERKPFGYVFLDCDGGGSLGCGRRDLLATHVRAPLPTNTSVEPTGPSAADKIVG